MSDAHLKNSKSKLQQDDPSIILCTVKEQSKQMLSNEKQVASSNYNLKQKTFSPSSRPKTGPARYYGRLVTIDILLILLIYNLVTFCYFIFAIFFIKY